MDLAFLLMAERMLDRRSECGIDHQVLVATLAAHQQASATARAAFARTARRRAWDRRNEALVELLAGGPAWREAARVQCGTFNRRIAGRSATVRQPMSPARLPSHFSLPSRLAGYRAGDRGEAARPARDF
jgi:hypothetical protein